MRRCLVCLFLYVKSWLSTLCSSLYTQNKTKKPRHFPLTILVFLCEFVLKTRVSCDKWKLLQASRVREDQLSRDASEKQGNQLPYIRTTKETTPRKSCSVTAPEAWMCIWLKRNHRCWMCKKSKHQVIRYRCDFETGGLFPKWLRYDWYLREKRAYSVPCDGKYFPGSQKSTCWVMKQGDRVPWDTGRVGPVMHVQNTIEYSCIATDTYPVPTKLRI